HRDGVPSAEQAAMSSAAWTLSSPKRLALAQRASGLGGRVLSRLSRREDRSGRAVLSWLPLVGSKWTRSRDMPVPPSESFRRWWHRRSR
ncbi:MAG: lactate utilization protein LutB domain-containing protein, partial [Janibacter sp.]